MVERGAGPVCRRMAGVAGGGKRGRHVIRICGADEVCLVA